MSRETVVCTASLPASRSASASSACVESGALLDEAQDRALALELVGLCETSVRNMHQSIAWRSTSSRVTSAAASGAGRSRRPAEDEQPASTQAAIAAGVTTGATGRSTRPSRRPAAAAPRTPGSAAQAAAARSAPAHDVREEFVVDRVADRARRRAGDGVAAEGRRVVAGLEPLRAPRRRRAARRSAGRSRAPWRA